MFFTEAIYETISSLKSETKVEIPLIDIGGDDFKETTKEREELKEEKNLNQVRIFKEIKNKMELLSLNFSKKKIL